MAAPKDEPTKPEPFRLMLEGDAADLYARYGQAAARLRAAGAAYEQAKSDYQALLAQFTASAEKHVTG